MKVQQICPKCSGRGRLPALGFDGLAPDDPARRVVTRNFERLCSSEDGGCDGTGWLWVDVSLVEGMTGAVPNRISIFDEWLVKTMVECFSVEPDADEDDFDDE